MLNMFIDPGQGPSIHKAGPSMPQSTIHMQILATCAYPNANKQLAIFSHLNTHICTGGMGGGSVQQSRVFPSTDFDLLP